MAAGLGRRSRMALAGGALALLLLCMTLPAMGPEGPALWLLMTEAALCGAAAGAIAAPLFGADGLRGALRALGGGVTAAGLGLGLFGASAAFWLKSGAAALAPSDLLDAWPAASLAAAALMQGVEIAGAKAARLRAG